MRVRSQVDLHTILPGLLYSGLQGIGKIDQLPAFALPEELRVTRPEFAKANSALLRMHWGEYFITLGTRNVFIGPKLPYRGWPDFRDNALKVFQLLLKNRFVEAVERYSIKYVNLIPSVDLVEQNLVLDWDVRIGQNQVNKQLTQLRTELHDGKYLTIVQLSTGTEVEMVETKESKSGSLVDIDTLCSGLRTDVEQFSEELLDRLDEIRLHNKTVFFDCLKDSTIEAMGPKYE
jgi:uncharacterized protein (TIGR04255 family)